MFPAKTILGFLTELKSNNNRDWFNRNKGIYLEAREAMELLVTTLIMEIHQMDPSVPVIPARDCMFRIYRDTRFSYDKTPYKTNMGAYISRGGRNSALAGYYIHLEPGASMLAGGIYMPQPEVLRAIRSGVYEHFDDFLEIIEDPTFVRHFGALGGEKLSRPPKGFTTEFVGIEYLKHKSFVVMKNIPDEMVVSELFLEEARRVFSALFPLNRFLNECVEHLA